MNSSPLTRRRLLGRMASLVAGAAVVPALAQTALAQAGKGAAWNRDYELLVNFEINQPDGGRYRRPYVAVWIEDANGNAVRTLALWVQTRKPGPRWIPDLKRWYRKEQARQDKPEVANGGGDLIETISVATRQPGQYTVKWNGRNDNGKLMPQGTYAVCVEAAREHGTYQSMREVVSVGSQPFQKAIGSNIEIKGANVVYRKRA